MKFDTRTDQPIDLLTSVIAYLVIAIFLLLGVTGLAAVMKLFAKVVGS